MLVATLPVSCTRSAVMTTVTVGTGLVWPPKRQATGAAHIRPVIVTSRPGRQALFAATSATNSATVQGAASAGILPAAVSQTPISIRPRALARV